MKPVCIYKSTRYSYFSKTVTFTAHLHHCNFCHTDVHSWDNKSSQPKQYLANYFCKLISVIIHTCAASLSIPYCQLAWKSLWLAGCVRTFEAKYLGD